jgi:hypothetical protein
MTCIGCHNRLAGWLTAIGQDYVRLDAMPSRGGPGIGRRAPGFHSCPPVDLHRAALRDPRTAPDAATKRGQSPANFVITWARWVRERRNQIPAALPSDTDVAFHAELRYLLASLDWVTRQPWVVTFTEQLRPVHRTLHGTITGVRSPRPYARCASVLHDDVVCGHPLFPPRPGAGVVVCGGCETVYSPLDALRAMSEEATP